MNKDELEFVQKLIAEIKRLTILVEDYKVKQDG